MRLLKASSSDGFELLSFNDDNPPPYAILSHTWNKDQEVTHAELVAGLGREKDGFAKIGFCVARAAKDGIDYCWVDTCCINKSDSTEVSTAINSMFRYYQRANKCYVYLSDVRMPEEVSDAEAFRITWEAAFRRSRWFTRGWTLQELLAPSIVEFFSQNGRLLGSKTSLECEIHDITQLPIAVLRGQQSFSTFSVEERLNWAAQRETTLKEDKVYCLLGIFGVFLPIIYGEGEAYATARLKDEIERRQRRQGMNNLQDVTVSSPLPFPRNEQFVGREGELRSLEEFLLPNMHRRISVYGLGGCGKSALVLEFAYRALARDARRLVFWVPAINQESFERAYYEIGIRLGVPGMGDGNADIKQLVKEALNLNKRDWLMIVDNADDPEVLMNGADRDPKKLRLPDYLPYNDRGKIVFTTRSRKVASDLTLASMLELKDMGHIEARQLLERRITKRALLTEGRAVDELLETLTFLALALVQAAAFINSNDISVAAYVSLLRKTKTDVFGEKFEDPSRYRETESTIAKTWYISFEQIRKRDPLAAEYLAFMACVDRTNIPLSLLPPADPLQQTKSIGTLKGYAFITERQQALPGQGTEVFFDMHRLVHMMSARWLQGHNKRKDYAATAAERLEEILPYGGHENNDVWTRYLPHAIHLATLEDTMDEENRVSLLDRVGECQWTLGQYAGAAVMHQQAFAWREKNIGLEDVITLKSKSALALALAYQGKYAEAESMFRQTLATQEKVLGVDHPDTLMTIRNLALVLEYQGKYAEAESIFRQTLATQEKVLGVDHPDTLITMHNLALVLEYQGKYAEAESIFRQTLATQEKVLGVDHPGTLMNIYNLAAVLQSQGKYTEAESMFEQTLATQEKVLGVDHPSTLGMVNNMVLMLQSQGKHAKTESMFRQTLATGEKVLGLEHPYMLLTINNTALVLQRQGKYAEAESIFRQTLATQEKVLGVDHPSTLGTVNNLALVLQRQSKYAEAESMFRQALVTLDKALGVDHPETLRTTHNLALVLRRQRKYAEAESMYRQTLATREKVLGVDHPDVLRSVWSLAVTLEVRKCYVESGALYGKACAGFSAALGEDHPDTRACRQDHSRLLAWHKQSISCLSETDRGHSEGSVKTSKKSRRLAERGLVKWIFSRKP